MTTETAKARSHEWDRVGERLAAVRPVTGVFLSILVAIPVGFLLVATLTVSDPGARLGIDYEVHMGSARQWLAGGGFYWPWQFTQTYGIAEQPVLYPPVALALFVPMSFLPAVLWWAIPLGIIGYALWHHRPRPWAWPLMTAGFLFPTGAWMVWSGNALMWIAAFVALATLGKGAGPLILLKPTLAPFALIGIRDRRWWVALVGVAALALLALPLWFDYRAVMANFTAANPLYSLPDYPLMAGIVVAWWASPSSRGRPASAATGDEQERAH